MKNVAVILALVLLLPAAVLAQAQTSGTISGVVVDEAGEPVAGAAVTLSSPALQGERATETRENGQFLARLLPPGDYTVVVSAPGHQAAVMTITVLVGDTQPLEVTLLPGEDFAEEIVVHGRRSALETAETRTTFDYTEEVDELPIQNRNINFIAYNAPNTSFGPNAGQVAVAGAPSYDTVVLLDGAEISDPYFGSGTTVYLEDSIQEVQTLTTGISARYGRFQGGVVNAITKSGGNQFSGMLRTELDKETWNSQTPFEEDQTDDLNEVYQATLGGFVVKDRLWFFGGYRTIPDTSQSNTTLFGDSFATTVSEDRYQGKLRAALTSNHTLDVSYLEFDGETSNRAGLPAGDLLAVGQRADPRDMTSVMYQGVLGLNTFLDAITTEKNASIASGGDPNGGDPILDRFTFRVFNNHWWDFSDPAVRDNQTAAANLSHVVDTDRFGGHMLQGGVQWVESSTAGDNRQSATGFNMDNRGIPDFVFQGPDGAPRFNLRPDSGLFRWDATNLQAQNDVENLGFYVQDTISWRDFRFDLGVRYDDYEGRTTGVQAFDMAFDDISPRLGVTYNINPAWQVLGTWGKYVGRFNDSWGENASGVSSAPRVELLYVGPEMSGLTADEAQAVLRNDDFWTLNTLFGDPAFPTTFLTGDVSSPFSEEFNLSLRRALPRGSGFVSLTYTQRDYNDLMTDYRGLVCTDFNLSFDVPCPAGDRVPVPGGETDTVVWGNDSRATREYEALAMQVDYRPSARFSLGGSWTWSDTEGNYEGEGTNTPASGSVIGSNERSWPFESGAPIGFLDTHIEHRANLYGTYRFNFDRLGTLSTSGLLNYRSGFVWSREADVPTAVVPEYLTTLSTYTHFFDGRGSNEFDSVWGLDVAARYEIPLYQRLNLFLKVDIRNVLNLDALSGRDGTTTREGFETTGQAVEVTNPDGTFSHWAWAPLGNCGPGDSPSTECTNFGRISSENNYQAPRTYLLSVGLQF